MGKIINGNFGNTENMENIANAEQTGMDNGEVVEIGRVRLNGLKVILTEPNKGEYAVSVYKTDEIAATFRKTDNFNKAWDVFVKIGQHIHDNDRTFEELVACLVNEIY